MTHRQTDKRPTALYKGMLKGRSRRLRPKAYILDDPLSNPNDGLKVLAGGLYCYKGPL